jgi:indolepyruvate ferredoxin oxidoreductase alpha subunit
MKGFDMLTKALRRSADAFYTVPGYPVTAIAGALDAALVVNEKVGLEYALGDSLSGRRAALIIKNVGLNACADPLVNATTQGLSAGVVVIAGDDVDVLGSQNAQDSRYYGELAQVPVIEPDAATMGEAVEEAFRASERFSRIALLRITPAALEAEAAGQPAERQDGQGRLAERDLTMKGRADAADLITARMFAWSRQNRLNRLQEGTAGVGAAPGRSRVVTVYPPPAGPKQLSATAELGRPFVHEHRCIDPPREIPHPESFADRGWYRTFCRGCPFKPLLSCVQERRMQAVCDIGCALLAQNPPFEVGLASYGLGSSIAVAARSTGIALIGDYALLHSGINALIDVREKGIPLLCIVLDNKRLGMAGGHPAPALSDYISWADPVFIDAADRSAIARVLEPPRGLKVAVVSGTCPEGEKHETVEY